MLAIMRSLLLAAVVTLASGACTEKAGPPAPAAEAPHAVPVLSIADVAAGLAARTLTVVECNGAQTRKKHGVLPGAILIDDEETFTASALPGDTATKLVFCCGGRGRTSSHTGAGRALEIGYANVFVMSEGTAGWTKAGQPTTPP